MNLYRIHVFQHSFTYLISLFKIYLWPIKLSFLFFLHQGPSINQGCKVSCTLPVSTVFSSEGRARLRDWAIRTAQASCYSWAALSSNASNNICHLQTACTVILAYIHISERNLDMKITRSRNFHGCVGKILGEEDRFRLPPMGFSLSETRLEFFFDFELFSSSYQGF